MATEGSAKSSSTWDDVGKGFTAIVLFVIAIVALIYFGRWAWTAGSADYSHDNRHYRGNQARSTTAPQYAPRRVEYIPQRQPEGGYRCVVGGRPGWCR